MRQRKQEPHTKMCGKISPTLSGASSLDIFLKTKIIPKNNKCTRRALDFAAIACRTPSPASRLEKGNVSSESF